MKRLMNKIARKKEEDPFGCNEPSKISTRIRKARDKDKGDIFIPGGGYNARGEAVIADFVSEYAHLEPQQYNFARPSNPAIDAMIEEINNAQYAAQAYIIEMPKPPMTREDVIADLMAAMDADTTPVPSIKEIPLRKLAIIPWPFGDDNTYSEDRICSACAAARLERLMIVNKPEGISSTFSLSKVKQNATVPGCPMCRLLLATFRGSDDLLDPPFGNQTVIQARWNSFSTLMRTSVKGGQIAVQHLGGGRRIYTKLVHAQLSEEKITIADDPGHMKYGFQLIHVPRNDPREFAYFGTGRLLGSTANNQRLKIWINYCLDGHAKKCQRPDTTTLFHPGFRVIDVQKRCVVDFQTPQGNQFVALSYVWGRAGQLLNQRATRSRLYQEGGLSDSHDDIPRTIKDAMLLCEDLNFRFLWVDALCIQQDDDQDKKVQIANMDAVYSRAVLTIVAACGTDCNYGLPGVRQDSRIFHQTVETVGGITLASIAGQLRNAITSSHWDTRGWTLQEKLLSRRLLIVTDTQIIWRCSNGSWYEDAQLEVRGDHTFTLNDESGWPLLDDEAQPSFDRYRDLALSFIHRSFTFEGDGLNAVMGINKKMALGLGGSFHQGVPEKYLDACILWDWPGMYEPSRLPRLKHFPSWSWISLSVPESAKSLSGKFWSAVTTVNEYIDSNTRMRLNDKQKDIKICTLVRYYRFTENCEKVKIRSEVFEGGLDPHFRAYLDTVKHPPFFPPPLDINLFSSDEEYQYHMLRFKESAYNGIVLHQACNDLLPRAVAFVAYITSFYVAATVSTETAQVQRFRVATDPKFTNVVGHVALDSRWRSTQTEKLEFVAVARHVSNGPHMDLPRTEGWFLHCLLVERVFDAKSLRELGDHAVAFCRKVAVMFDVDCNHWYGSKLEPEMILLI